MDTEGEFSSTRREALSYNGNESEDAWWAYLQNNHKLSQKRTAHFLFIDPVFSSEYPAALSRRLFSIGEAEIWPLLDRYLGKHKSWQLRDVMHCMVNYALTLHYNDIYSNYASGYPEVDLEKVNFEFVPTHKRIVNAIIGWIQVREWELMNKEGEDEDNEEAAQPMPVKVEPVVQEPVQRTSAKLDFGSLCKAPFTPEDVDAVLREAGLIDSSNNFHAHSKGKAGLPAAYRVLVAKQKMHDKTNGVWSKLFGERYNVTISPATAKFNLGSSNVTRIFLEYCKSIEGIVEGLDVLDSVMGNLLAKKL